MVTGMNWSQEIVKFKEINIGEEIASTKTGCHYVKTSDDSWSRVKDDRWMDQRNFERIDEDAVITPDTLVYRHPYRADVFY